MASTAREENAYTLGVQAGLWGYPLVHRVEAFPQTLVAKGIGHNSFRKFDRLKTADDQFVVTPNNLTVGRLRDRRRRSRAGGAVCAQLRPAFEPGQTPPVAGMWNIAMYDDAMLLIANEIDRFSIGSTTDGLAENSDGSLTIYLQHTSRTMTS